MADEIQKAQQPTEDPRTTKLRGFLFARKGRIESLLPKGGTLTVEKLLGSAMMATKKVDALLSCDPESLFLAIMDAAELGLTVHWGPRAEAAIVPFKSTATLMIGYRGLIVLAQRGAGVTSIHAEVVRQNDTFRYEVTQKGQQFRHIPTHDNAPPRLYYAAAWRGKEDCSIQVVTLDKIEKVKAGVAARTTPEKWKSSPWNLWPEEMGLKTAVRQLMKLLPSYEVDRGLELEEKHAEIRGEVVDSTATETAAVLRALPPPAPQEFLERAPAREPARVVRDEKAPAQATGSGSSPSPEAAKPEPDLEREAIQAEAQEAARAQAVVTARAPTGPARGTREFGLWLLDQIGKAQSLEELRVLSNHTAGIDYPQEVNVGAAYMERRKVLKAGGA